MLRRMADQCFIQCRTALHQPILVEDKKCLTLGRSRLTKIKDPRCSKEQLEFKPNYKNYEVEVKQIGPNQSSAKGKPLSYNECSILKHGDTFEFLSGVDCHEIQFMPSPKLELSSSKPMKRKNEEIECQPMKLAKFKVDEVSSSWQSVENEDLLVLNGSSTPSSSKIAAYDMDGTLITTQSGLVFPKDINDWKILFNEVPGKLKQLSSDGYKIVLFTNQAGIKIGKNTVICIQEKIGKVLKKLGVAAQVFVSTGKSKYRKPMTGMWTYFVENCNDNIDIDMSDSFYVGDAAGRLAVSKQKKKDHSCADRLFALNIGIPFYTPEEHFLGHKPREYVMPEFDPRKTDCTTLFEPKTEVPKHTKEVILLIGYPGCGKSTFVKTQLLTKGYHQISRDTLGNWQKCVSQMDLSLQNGQNVVIDNTNPDVESRKRYIDVAMKHKVPIRCFMFAATMNQAKHNNKFRELSGSGHTKVSDMVYNSYKSKYQEPTLDEGFDDIIKVNFVTEFKTKSLEALYKMFLLEK